MNPAFRKGSLAVDFPAAPFRSPVELLLRSASVYFGNFFFIVSATLLVFLPAKAFLHIVMWMLEIETKSLSMYLVLSASDLVLASLVTPAVVYGLLDRFRGKPLPPLGECFRWGRRQFAKTFWNKVKVEITVTLRALLLVVPGVIASVRLIFTDMVVAIEGDRETEVLQRSRDLAEGRGWRIFFVILPVGVVEMVGSYFVLSAFQGSTYSRPLLAVVDSLLSAGGQWTTVVALLMYLGIRREPGA